MFSAENNYQIYPTLDRITIETRAKVIKINKALLITLPPPFIGSQVSQPTASNRNNEATTLVRERTCRKLGR
jgi:hypothetical protein